MKVQEINDSLFIVLRQYGLQTVVCKFTPHKLTTSPDRKPLQPCAQKYVKLTNNALSPFSPANTLILGVEFSTQSSLKF